MGTDEKITEGETPVKRRRRERNSRHAAEQWTGPPGGGGGASGMAGGAPHPRPPAAPTGGRYELKGQRR